MKADVVIIGAGVLGSSVAFGLAQRGVSNIVVIDADLSGELASSTLNVGGVRATWGWPVNIELSLRSLEYFWSIREEIRYQRLGYLWLYDEEQWPRACAAFDHQNSFGLNVQSLTPADVDSLVDEIDCLDGVAGACFSPLDGLVDSVRIKWHYQREAKQRGVKFVDGWFVARIEQEENKWRLHGHQIEERSELIRLLVQQPADLDEQLLIDAPVVVNAAGPWAARIARLYGDEISSEPVRRQVFYVTHPDLHFNGNGLIVDTSGAFIQPLGNHHENQILCGYANPGEPTGYCFDWDGLPFYNEWVHPRLSHRISAYRDAKVVNGWARLYDNSPDRSGIIGRVAGKPGIYQIHSFSGHGVMQSYGAGQSLAELINEGQFRNWKVAAALNPERFDRGELVFETLFI